MTLVALAVLGRGVVPVDTPLLHADDEGVLRGRSVFETLRVYDGVPFKLDEHLDRLAMSAERIHLPPPPRAELASIAQEAIAAGAHPDATLRFLWIAGREHGGAPIGLALVSTLPPDLDAQRARGLRLSVLRWSPGALAGVKSTSYAANMAAQDEAVRAGADDGLSSQLTTRCSRRRPRMSGSARPIACSRRRSSCRSSRASPARRCGSSHPRSATRSRKAHTPLARLLGADEIFLSASIREVMPVVAVAGVELPRGPAAAALQTALRAAAGYPEGQ